MVQYSAYGFDQLRSYVQTNWNWVALLDDGGSEQLRWDLTSNANVTVVSDESANPLEYAVTVTGQDLVDAGASLPVTLQTLELYESSSATTAVGSQLLQDPSGTATTATLEATTDSVDLTVTQEIPPQ